MTANWSLNEIEALARKAARGAGYDWGLAEEAGQAVRWLLAHNLPGADALLLACDERALEATLCPLVQGCALSDGLVTAPGFAESNISAPLLVLPFLAWTAERQKATFCLTWPGAAFAVSADGTLSWRAEIVCPDRADIAVSDVVPVDLDVALMRHRAQVDRETCVRLSDLAGRTYAPSTQASRESGAGAGLSDND